MADPIQSVAPAAPASAKDGDRAKVKLLAQQFESMLMTQMLRSMRQSMLSDEESDGFGKSTMTDAFDSELGQALSRAGGIGLSSVLIRAFDRQAGAGEPATVSPDAAPVPATVDAPATPDVPATGALPVLPAGRVTSGFGWRNDPFSGAVKFHSGTDLQMAYGQAVKSAAAGRISFVGEQSGYGLTVMVDHGNGVQSRYAHLSSATVQPGDDVGSGQVIARSGNSGRSTGPHLHFEVLEHGRAVAPIKGMGSVAD
jgi:murein DD-endopeptidase MepM/ murein hydrolase activator NlpD